MSGGSFAELRRAVARANNEVAAAGLVVHAFGNASGVDRENDVFAIKPSGVPCERVADDDVVVVSLSESNIVWGDKRPSSDTPTHRAIYLGLETVGGVVHTHSLYATAWAQARVAVPCLGTTHADHFRGSIPVTRPLIRSEIEGEYEANTGDVIVEMFNQQRLDPVDTPGALVASHGPFAWGYTPLAAVEIASAMELLARLASETLAINADVPPIEESLLERHFSRKHGPHAYYGQP
jgi:L-ribulose-5-phosphate 4-epimerase